MDPSPPYICSSAAMNAVDWDLRPDAPISQPKPQEKPPLLRVSATRPLRPIELKEISAYTPDTSAMTFSIVLLM